MSKSNNGEADATTPALSVTPAPNSITLETPLKRGDQTITAVNLRMRVLAKETLRLRLPDVAGLFNVFVNDEGATLVREGEDWWIEGRYG